MMTRRRLWAAASLAIVIVALAFHAGEAAEPATECDRLAGSPDDVRRVADGVGLYGVDADAAIPACEKAVAENPSDARPLYELGRAYEARALGGKASAEAAKAYRAAADRGYPAAKISAAGFDWRGVGDHAPDLEKAMRELNDAARTMPAQAKRQRANLYSDTALNPDAPQSTLAFIEAAAKGGDADALYALGLRASFDPQQRDETVRLWTRAAALGQAQAAVELARRYAQGRDGLAKNLEEAGRLMKRAETSDDPAALVLLAIAYRDGRNGLTEDAKASAKLLLRAGDNGDAYAQNTLAGYYERAEGGFTRNPSEAARRYELAAEAGNGDAAVALARFMSDGLGGFAPDRAKAAAYLKRAARWSREAKKALEEMGERP
jgi:TPR repeat protein